jgi:hypothetical protein
MTIPKLRRTTSLWACLLVPMLVGSFFATSRAEEAMQGDARTVALPLVLREESTTIHLPSISNRAPTVTAFGVSIDVPNVNAPFLKPLNVEWLRVNGPSWREVQPTEGGSYNWDVDTVRKFERGLQTLQTRGISPRIVVIINGSPSWATTDGSLCGPIRSDRYAAFADYMRAVAQRYRTITYFELGNEPDVDVSDVDPMSGFGCWGKKDDEFYGGRAYGEMLKVVYPALKGVNGAIQVLNGGLLLDRPFDAATGNNRSARFIEGVFEAGAGASFDIMNYHAYTYYNGTPDGVTTVGSGAVDWKAAYLREIMTRYGVTEKPLMNTEAALLCRDVPLDPCRDAQASMVGRLYARAARDRISAVIWYLLDSDRFGSTALVKPDRSGTNPVYGGFQHARTLLGGAEYVGALADQPEGVEGHRFQNGSLDVTIFWSDQADRTATVAVPRGSTPQCTDRAGAIIACSNDNGVVRLPATSRPTYVVVP